MGADFIDRCSDGLSPVAGSKCGSMEEENEDHTRKVDLSLCKYNFH